jgi:hypothetical protein
MSLMSSDDPHRLDYARPGSPVRPRLIGGRRLALGVLIGMTHWLLGLGLLSFFEDGRRRHLVRHLWDYPVGWLLPQRDWYG